MLVKECTGLANAAGAACEKGYWDSLKNRPANSRNTWYKKARLPDY